MKLFFYLLIFALLSSLSLAFAPHATVVTVRYKNQMWPVHRMESTDPVILYKGKEKQLKTEPIYVLDRASRYADNRIEFSSLSLGGNSTRFVANTSNDINSDRVLFGLGHGTTFFEATLQSERTVKEGFVAIVIYTTENLTEPPSRYNQTEIMVRELPELSAGQDVSIKFKSAMINGGIDARYFIQVFDHQGIEIPSNVMSKSWRYYAMRDQEQLKRILPGYLQQNSGASRGVTPVVMPKPFLPLGINPPESPVEALIDISAEGLVTQVKIIGLEPGTIHSAITGALEGWLFLPRLEDGNPVAAKAQVPINF